MGGTFKTAKQRAAKSNNKIELLCGGPHMQQKFQNSGHDENITKR